MPRGVETVPSYPDNCTRRTLRNTCVCGRPRTGRQRPVGSPEDRHAGSGSGDRWRSDEGVVPGALPEPGRARLRAALERLPVDGDEAEFRPVAVGPFEVVEQAPREVAADVDAVVQTAANTPESVGVERHALVVVVGGDAVLGDDDRQAGHLGGPANGVLCGLRPVLVPHLRDRAAVGRRPQLAAGTETEPGVALDADEVVAGGGAEERVLQQLLRLGSRCLP